MSNSVKSKNTTKILILFKFPGKELKLSLLGHQLKEITQNRKVYELGEDCSISVQDLCK